MQHLWDALFQLINFAILAWVVVKFGKKPVVDMIENRRREVTRLIDESETRRKEALASLEETRQQLATADGEIALIASRASEMGEALKKDLVATAQKEAERLRLNTKEAIALETRMAIADIRQEVINQAFEGAAADFASLPPETHERLIQDFARKVGEECAK
ncbi:MAG: ATP synthase F0 subunit B [Bacteroidota bacterium]